MHENNVSLNKNIKDNTLGKEFFFLIEKPQQMTSLE